MASDLAKRAIDLHRKYRGKLEMKSKLDCMNKEGLSLAYTPGVADVCREIVKNPDSVYDLTFKWNTVAVVSDGTRVLGLGNIGPLAGLPVMEGKAILFKSYANVDAFPICLACSTVDEIVATVKNISPVFGGINLEDIESPKCFEVERRLKQELDMPVFHDDQHGTAVVVVAGLLNALKVVGKKKLIDKMEKLKVKFMEGCEKNGFGPKAKLEQIWSDWAEFAKYAFNKSHATCYSWIAYQTAYLKAHYPAEFMAANLTRNKDDITEVGKFMDECKNLGMSVMGPDVNESDLTFTVNSEGNIRFGLGGVKGVGEGAVEAIVNERNANGKYKSMFDLIERGDHNGNVHLQRGRLGSILSQIRLPRFSNAVFHL